MPSMMALARLPMASLARSDTAAPTPQLTSIKPQAISDPGPKDQATQIPDLGGTHECDPIICRLHFPISVHPTHGQRQPGQCAFVCLEGKVDVCFGRCVGPDEKTSHLNGCGWAGSTGGSSCFSHR